MLRMIETAGDRLLTLVVPRVRAAADPGCECHGQAGKVITPFCYCACGAGSFGTPMRDRCTCDGCHWQCRGRCDPDWWGICTCP